MLIYTYDLVASNPMAARTISFSKFNAGYPTSKELILCSCYGYDYSQNLTHFDFNRIIKFHMELDLDLRA